MSSFVLTERAAPYPGVAVRIVKNVDTDRRAPPWHIAAHGSCCSASAAMPLTNAATVETYLGLSTAEQRAIVQIVSTRRE